MTTPTPFRITANFSKTHFANALITLPQTNYVSGPPATAIVNGVTVPNFPTMYGNPGAAGAL